MGANKHKLQKRKVANNQDKYQVSLCPTCGNVIPRRFKPFRCKFCTTLIMPEDNNVKERWKNVED